MVRQNWPQSDRMATKGYRSCSKSGKTHVSPWPIATEQQLDSSCNCGGQLYPGSRCPENPHDSLASSHHQLPNDSQVSPGRHICDGQPSRLSLDIPGVAPRMISRSVWNGWTAVVSLVVWNDPWTVTSHNQSSRPVGMLPIFGMVGLTHTHITQQSSPQSTAMHKPNH